MATGVVDCAEDLASGHDEVYDWTCGQCEETGNITEATAYCRDCDEAYCDPCRKIHGRFPAMKNHKVLDDSQKDDWGNDTGTRGSTHPCPDHDGQTISMFCGDHDTLCCPVCVSLEHRGCDDMAYIPMISKDISKSNEFLKTQDDISATMTDNNGIIKEAEEAHATLDNSRKVAVEKICKTKQQVIDTFDKLEEKAISEVDNIHKGLEDELVDMSNSYDDACKGLGIFSQRLKPDDSVRDSELFVLMKMSQTKVLECHSMGQKLKHKTSTEKFKIAIDVNPEVHAIRAIATLGHVEKRQATRLYTLSEEFECKVDRQHEKHYSKIGGMYRFSNGTILLSDQANRTLKLLNSNYTLIGSYELPGCPSQICRSNETDPTEMVVAILNGSLQFISVTDLITPTKNIKVNHKCNGVMYYHDRFYISDSSRQIYIYTVTGENLKLVKTIANDKEGNSLFYNSQEIEFGFTDVSNAPDVIYIADRTYGIVTLDRDDNYMRTVNPTNLGGCYKAVSDKIGNMFVLNANNCVLQLGENGETVLGTLAKKAKLLFMDAERSELYVWCECESSADKQLLKIFKP